MVCKISDKKKHRKKRFLKTKIMMKMKRRKSMMKKMRRENLIRKCQLRQKLVHLCIQKEELKIKYQNMLPVNKIMITSSLLHKILLKTKCL